MMNGFRQEVTYNVFGLGFNYIDSSYTIATMSHIDMLTFIEKIASLHLNIRVLKNEK